MAEMIKKIFNSNPIEATIKNEGIAEIVSTWKGTMLIIFRTPKRTNIVKIIDIIFGFLHDRTFFDYSIIRYNIIIVPIISFKPNGMNKILDLR